MRDQVRQVAGHGGDLVEDRLGLGVPSGRRHAVVVCEHAEPREYLEERSTLNGVIEIGAVSRGTAAGVVVQGRGRCFGLHASLAVDDCTHSTDLAPEARVEVASSAGLVVARSPESPTRAPDLTVGVGAEYAVQLTARHCGFGEGVDIAGGWRGAVMVADDVTDREMASIEAALLDDVAGKVWSSDRWERTEDVR